jgi:pyruvate formate lyase activating enzyme
MLMRRRLAAISKPRTMRPASRPWRFTAGYIAPDVRREFFAHMDAANVDLKAFTEDLYRAVCGGHLEGVVDTLVYLKQETSVWFEITTLLIPG